MRLSLQLMFVFSLSLVIALAGLVQADVKAQFETLFGAEVKRVSATPDPADDVELAGQLLNAAKGTSDQPEMRDHLCDYAYALGSRDISGYPVAVEAMQLIAENTPAKAAESEAKIVLLYQRGYERATGEKKAEAGQQYLDYLLTQADEKIIIKDYSEAMNLLRKARPVAIAIKSDQRESIQGKIDTYTQLAIAAGRVDTAQKKIKANPWDKATHSQLVELYVTDMDDPAKAALHLELGGDEVQKKMIPLAVKPVTDMDEAGALALADYYEGLSKKGINITKAAMLTRSKAYYEQYLSLHTDEDVQRTAASLNHKRVSDTLAKLEIEMGGVKRAEAADAKTLELLVYVDPARDGQRGRWTRVGDAIKADRGGFTELPRLRPPVRIEGLHYNLKVRFTRDSGDGSVGIVFPVGDSQVSYVMNLFPQGAAGLSDVGGRGAAENATRKDVSLTNGKVTNLDITVKAEEDGTAAIAISFEGRSVVEWKGRQADLSVNNLVSPGERKVVALIAFGSGVTFTNVKLKMLSGKADAFEKIVDRATKIESLKAAEKDKGNNRDDERREREKMIEDFIKGRRGKAN